MVVKQSRNGRKMVWKWYKKMVLKQSRNGLEMVWKWSGNGLKNGLKTVQKWSGNGLEMVQKWSRNSLKNGLAMVWKWSGNGLKKVQKRFRNGCKFINPLKQGQKMVAKCKKRQSDLTLQTIFRRHKQVDARRLFDVVVPAGWYQKCE